MANRFPLIVDSSGTAAIKELASGDNLDLTGNGIVGAGTVALTNLTVGGSQGTDGQVLTSTGSGVQWEDAASGGGGGGGAWNVVSSTTLSSAATSVELTLSGYDSYEIRFDKMDPSTRTSGSTAEYLRVYFSTNGGTSYSNNLKWKLQYLTTGNTNTAYYNNTSSYSGSNITGYIELIDYYMSSTYSHAGSGVISIENNYSGAAAKHGLFSIFGTRDYSGASAHTFLRQGHYGLEETGEVNKVKFDFTGGQIPSGTRFTVYGLSTS